MKISDPGQDVIERQGIDTEFLGVFRGKPGVGVADGGQCAKGREVSHEVLAPISASNDGDFW